MSHGKEYIATHLQSSLQEYIHYINDTYSHLDSHLKANSVDFILLDLGINREHVTDPER
jgi:16S rRNA C1402 N4-methylase RsmH